MSTENTNVNNPIETGWLSDYKGETAFAPNTLSSSVLLTEDGSIKLNEIINTKENTLTEGEITKTVKEIHIGSLSGNQAVSECSSTATGINSHAEGSGNASGDYSHAEGENSQTKGKAAHAENQGIARGDYSHAEGFGTVASGEGSHSEGRLTYAIGNQSHAEGSGTISRGLNSHAEGINTTTGEKAEGSHAEGINTMAFGLYSHVEGINTTTGEKAEGSHAEGINTNAFGLCSHAEGESTVAQGNYSHAEGFKTLAENIGSHAEGEESKSKGLYSHAEGKGWAVGDYSHAESSGTSGGNYSHAEGSGVTRKEYSHAEGQNTYTFGIGAHTEGVFGIAKGEYSHAEGYRTYADKEASHTEGVSSNLANESIFTYYDNYYEPDLSGGTIPDIIVLPSNPLDLEISETITSIDDINKAWGYNPFSIAYGEGSHVEGKDSLALGDYSHAEGENSQTKGKASHAEGYNTEAIGEASHAEGNSTHAYEQYSHAEGSSTFAEGQSSHAEGHNTHAKEKYSHAEGNYTWANKEASHAEGWKTSADGICSHAEGYYTSATGDYSHAEGYGENGINFGANGKYSHIEGYRTAANGEAAHAEGYDTRADGKASHVEGYSSAYWPGDPVVSGEMSEEMLEFWNGIGFTLASGDYSHAEGRDTLALGDYSHAEGYKTRASGEFSHAQGQDTKALGRCSFSGGLSTVANGQNDMVFGQGSITSYDDAEDEPYKYPYFSYAFGDRLISKGFQFVIGSYNTKPRYSLPFSHLGPAFIIGSGTSDDSRSNAFRVDYNGNVYSGPNGQFNTSGADYAEYFEWIDKNQEFQDRRGYFVTLEEEKIKMANSNDYILGVISSSPGIIGNSDEEWLGRYILDDFGSPIFEEYEYKDPITEENKIGKRYKQNPDYDPSLQYIQRADRPEWDAVGMLGVLSVRDDGTCKVNGYCTVADGGIATASETGYRVIKRVNDYIIKIIFK